MRILLTNNHLVLPGGTESWTLTMARHLTGLNHEVQVFAHRIGPYAAEFPCAVTSRPSGFFDLGLVNHNTCLPLARELCPQVVMTCHGVYPELEQPVVGADSYVAVSEEVQRHVGELGFEAQVIRNAISTSDYAPRRSIGTRLGRVLSLCQGSEAAYQVACAAALCGAEYRRKGLYHHRLTDLRAEIDWADCVVALGRTALESMAMGRAVVVYDNRSYMSPGLDGMIGPNNAADLMAFNFSGRCRQLKPTVAQLVAELGQYSQSMGQWNRDLVLEQFDVGRIWGQYCQLIRPTRMD